MRNRRYRYAQTTLGDYFKSLFGRSMSSVVSSAGDRWYDQEGVKELEDIRFPEPGGWGDRFPGLFDATKIYLTEAKRAMRVFDPEDGSITDLYDKDFEDAILVVIIHELGIAQFG